MESDRHQLVRGVLDSGGYKKRAGKLLVRAATAQPYSIRQLVPALQKKAEIGGMQEAVSYASQHSQETDSMLWATAANDLFCGASLNTLAWIPTSGIK